MAAQKLVLQNRSVPPTSRKLWAIAFQSLVLILSITGVAILVFDSKTISAALNLFSYYTIQSNLLAVAALALSIGGLAKDKEDSALLVIFKSGSVLWILVTGIVYHLMLANLWHPQGLVAFANLAVHYCVPAGMVLNWMVFEKKGRYKVIFALYWLSYPFLYIVVSWLRGWLTGFYPYWFFNPTSPYPDGAGSLGSMLMTVGALALGFFSLGLLIIFFDKLLVRRLHVYRRK